MKLKINVFSVPVLAWSHCQGVLGGNSPHWNQGYNDKGLYSYMQYVWIDFINKNELALPGSDNESYTTISFYSVGSSWFLQILKNCMRWFVWIDSTCLHNRAMIPYIVTLMLCSLIEASLLMSMTYLSYMIIKGWNCAWKRKKKTLEYAPDCQKAQII